MAQWKGSCSDENSFFSNACVLDPYSNLNENPILISMTCNEECSVHALNTIDLQKILCSFNFGSSSVNVMRHNQLVTSFGCSDGKVKLIDSLLRSNKVLQV